MLDSTWRNTMKKKYLTGIGIITTLSATLLSACPCNKSAHNDIRPFFEQEYETPQESTDISNDENVMELE
jgi:hypothetical protein